MKRLLLTCFAAVCCMVNVCAADNVPVSLPAGVQAKTWTLSGTFFDGQDYYEIQRLIQVAFNGTDVYVQGLGYYDSFKDGWVKGTLDIETGYVDFPCGQFITHYTSPSGYEYDIYIVGFSNPGDPPCEYTFQYDIQAKTLTQISPAILVNVSTTEIRAYGAWYDLVLSAGNNLPDLVELPLNANIQRWTQEGYQAYYDTDLQRSASVVFDGTDVYLQGLSVNNLQAWVKGTLNRQTGIVTFPCGQYVGQHNSYDMPLYIVGYDSSKDNKICDFQFKYDAAKNTLTQVTPFIVENYEPSDNLNYMSYWYDLVYTYGSPDTGGLVELPTGLAPQDWTLSGTYSDNERVLNTHIAFDGNDVYLQGLSNKFTDSWLKGTIDPGTGIVTIPSGQYVGEDIIGCNYMVGTDKEHSALRDIQFLFNTETWTLTLQTTYLVESPTKTSVEGWGEWSDAVYASNETVEYTVKYIDAQGRELKDARKGKSMPGYKVTLPDSDRESFVSNDGTIKYFYVSDNSGNVTITDNEANNVIYVTFSGMECYYATVTCEAYDGHWITLAEYEGKFFEGEQLTMYVPIGLRKDGKYYFTTPINGNAKPITFPGTSVPQVRNGKTYYTYEFSYNEDPTVAYYSEMEKLVLPKAGNEYGTGLGQYTGYRTIIDNEGIFSSGMSILLGDDSYLWTEPIEKRGCYQVTVYCYNNSPSYVDEPFALGYRDRDGNQFLYTNVSVPGIDAYEAKKIVVEGVNLLTSASLIVMNPYLSGQNPIYLDDIKLVRTGSFTELTAVGIQDIKDSNDLNDSEDAIYNLAGQRLNKTQKGINIVGGKKIFVK